MRANTDSKDLFRPAAGFRGFPGDGFRAFLDFFVLFSGISTRSNLARTQGRPLETRGVFLIRSK
jgi:hypothetical protein